MNSITSELDSIAVNYRCSILRKIVSAKVTDITKINVYQDIVQDDDGYDVCGSSLQVEVGCECGNEHEIEISI